MSDTAPDPWSRGRRGPTFAERSQSLDRPTEIRHARRQSRV